MKRGRSLQAQIQDLRDWIEWIEVEPEPTAEAFAPGALRAAWAAVQYLEPREDGQLVHLERCLSEMARAMSGYPNGLALLARIKRTHPSTTKRPFPSLAEMADDLLPIEWAWPSWLPLGMLTLLAARPGAGKSMLALDLAHRIIAGQPWPDGAKQTRPGAAVIYVDGENVPQILNARAERWGMPREKVYLLLPDDDDVILDLSQAKYQDKLSQMAYRIEPALIIVDSLGSVTAKGENAVEDTRALLGYLSGLAQANACGLLLIHHLRKASGQMSLLDGVDPDMVRGSSHIMAMARVAWGLSTVQTGPEPDRNGPRKLEVIKSNLSRYPEALGLVLEQMAGADGARVVYAPNAPKAFQEPTRGDDAEDWLLGYLETAGEPAKPADVVAAAEAAGLSRATIYRARKALRGQVVNTEGRKHPDNRWSLAEDAE